MKQNLTKEELEDFRHEVGVMSQIFHPNVVLFMGAATGSSNIRIVTELMSTDLETFLRKHGANTPLSTRIRMAKDAALGMNWLHGINHIIHRDLKPANLLVDENNRVKVTDFGFVRNTRSTTFSPSSLTHKANFFRICNQNLSLKPRIMEPKY